MLDGFAKRYRYHAKASHAANLPVANIAEAMGHTIEVHLGSYARFKPDATADLYAQVNEVLTNSPASAGLFVRTSLSKFIVIFLSQHWMITTS